LIQSSSPNDDGIRILLVGAVGVGKSCLVSRFIHDTFPTKPPTLCIQQTRIGQYNTKIETYIPSWRDDDIPPFRHFYAIAICFDMNSIQTFKSIPKWMKEIDRYGKEDVAIFIVGCKADFLAKPPLNTFVPFPLTFFQVNWCQYSSILCLSDFFTHLTPFLTFIHLIKLRQVCKWLYNTTLFLVKQFVNQKNTEVKKEDIELFSNGVGKSVWLTSSKHNIGVKDLFTKMVEVAFNRMNSMID